MKLNKELSQQSWQEVKHFVLDDSFGCEPPLGIVLFFRDYNRAFFAKLRRRRKVLKHPRTPTSGAS